MPYVDPSILQAIVGSANKYGIDARYLNRLIASESDYNPNAYNDKYGASGIAQFIPSTAKSFGINPFDAYQSIDASAKLLAQNLKKENGNYLLAIADYKGVDSTKPADERVGYANKNFIGIDASRVADISSYMNGQVVGNGGNLTVYDPTKPPSFFDDFLTSLRVGVKSAPSYAANKIDEKLGFSDKIVNYGLVGLGAVFIIIGAVRLSG